MKNTLPIVGVLLFLGLGGVGIYALSSKNVSMKKAETIEKAESMMKSEVTPVAKVDDAMMKKDQAKVAEVMMEKSGKYSPFSPEVLSGAASTRRVLFFYADWCPTCKPADKSFSQSISKIPSDVTIIRVNYNDTDTDQAEKDLAKKYGITYQHTFVQIDAQGNEVAKWNGGQIDKLLESLK